MADVKKAAGMEEGAAAPVHRIRITLSSRNVEALERGECCHAILRSGGCFLTIQLYRFSPFFLFSFLAACSDLKRGAEDKGLKGSISGPVRLPTKVLHITSRKTPCGEGSKTWNRWEMRIHKRIIDLHAKAELVKQITAITIDPSVHVEVSVADSK
jgi:small subunit ribosomal protein S20e